MKRKQCQICKHWRKLYKSKTPNVCGMCQLNPPKPRKFTKKELKQIKKGLRTKQTCETHIEPEEMVASFPVTLEFHKCDEWAPIIKDSSDLKPLSNDKLNLLHDAMQVKGIAVTADMLLKFGVHLLSNEDNKNAFDESFALIMMALEKYEVVAPVPAGATVN